jgi:predicted MFS family arabinose efflux permease
MEAYGQRSLPQIQALVTRTSASVGSAMVASGTSWTHLGWRGTFWAVAGLAAVAAVVIGRFAPKDEHGAAPSVGSELRALRSGRLWLVLAATVLVMGGCMGTFSFLSPLLTERSGIPLVFVPLVFVCFGVGSMIGTNVVGRFADRRPVATFIACATAAGLVLVMLIPLSADPVSAVIVITLLGVVTMAILRSRPDCRSGSPARLRRSQRRSPCPLSTEALLPAR